MRSRGGGEEGEGSGVGGGDERAIAAEVERSDVKVGVWEMDLTHLAELIQNDRKMGRLPCAVLGPSARPKN